MIREYAKIDDSHSKMTLTMQSSTEHSEWARVFPEHLPSTHRLNFEWSQNERGMPVLSVQPVLAESVKPNTADGELLQKLNAMSDGDLATFAAEKNIALPPGKKTRARVIGLIVEGMGTNNPA